MYNVKASKDIRRGEVITVMSNCGEDVITDDIKLVFKVLDCDNDGFLNKVEFATGLNMVTSFTAKELDDWFSRADFDRDGKIGLNDFVTFVTTYR